MLAAVTGANGHIGNTLVRLLIERGWRVRAGIHGADGALDGVDCERVPVEVTDPTTLAPLVEGADVLFHLAAVISIDGDRGGVVTRVNVEGAENAARAAHAAGVRRMVHVCSIHAFDPHPLDEVVDEDRRRAVDSPRAYDRSKALGEQAVRAVGLETGLEVVIVHPTAVIGPHDHARSRMGRVLLDLAWRKLPSLVPGGFDWVDVRDVAEGCLAAAERGRPQTSYLLSGRWASVGELAATARAITDVAPPRMTTPRWLISMAVPFSVGWGRLRRREPLFTFESIEALRNYPQISHARATAELGYTPRPLAETVYDAYVWFAADGALPPGLTLTGPERAE
ncbi:MAG: NAD-dependent epimerase/dehydratase family protein [bacterium]